MVRLDETHSPDCQPGLSPGAVIMAATMTACTQSANPAADTSGRIPLSTAGPNHASVTAHSSLTSDGSVVQDSQAISARPGVPAADLPCADAIGSYPPDAKTSLILGVVGLPASPRFYALQASDSGLADPAQKFFAKTGLTVKVGSSFTIMISADDADRARIGWGNPGQPTTHLTVDACPATTPGATSG